MNPRPNADALAPGLSRRTVLSLTAVGAAGVLTACGGGSSTTDAGSNGSGSSPSSGGDSSSGGDGGGGGLVKTADVPVGNGVILDDHKIVVVQPTQGDFKAYSAVCTHQGCAVASVKDGTIICPCHGSTYSVKDGSVTGGPAPRALSKVHVTVQGDEVIKA